jgi:trimeric autotransporter adhesin
MTKKLFSITSLILFIGLVSHAQSTEMTYQGQLQISSAPANGTFDFEFVLYDSPGGGSPIGPANPRASVPVANGIFSVNLDFGLGFPGATRYLEIRVRPSGGGSFTTLSPRQAVTSTPYTIKSLSADNAVNANNATTANSAVTATNFTGNLAGDVTGTQSGTTVGRIQNRNVAPITPLNGQVLKYNGSTNQWTPDTDNTGSGGGGTITGVTPGTGLTGGGTTGSVSLAIAPGGVGSTELATNAVTTTKVADSAVTAPKIATGQVVKSVTVQATTLTDNVTLAAGNNITITPTGNTLTIAATAGAGGVTGGGTTGRIPLFSGAAAIGDSLISQTGSEVNMPSVVRFAPSGSRQVLIGTPNSEAGLTFTAPSARADIRYDGMLKIVNGPGGIQGSENGIAIANNGNVGIGRDPCSVDQVCIFATDGFALSADNTGDSGTAVRGASGGAGVFSTGVIGGSINGSGVYGTTNAAFDSSSGRGTGVTGRSNDLSGNGVGVYGIAEFSNGIGVLGDGDAIGVAGFSTTGDAVNGLSTMGTGVYGETFAANPALPGIYGVSIGSGGVGVRGEAMSGVSTGVFGVANAGTGVTGQSSSGSGVYGSSVTGLAGNFQGKVRVATFGSGGTLAVCLNAANEFAFCSSSKRYKSDVTPFRSGLPLLTRLRPVTFIWKADNQPDIGLVAEDVAKVEPLLVTRNDRGEVEGVKYDRINLLIINVVKEQQAQIEALVKANTNLTKRLRSVEKKLRKRPR